MDSRQSRRADGRGWGARGDARHGEANPRHGEGPAAREAPGPRGEPGERARGQARHSAFGAPAGDDGRLRGPGDSPWIRLEDPGSPTGGRAGAGRGAPPLPDLSALLVVLEGVRGMVPREVSAQLNALVRELLLTLRALIDWYLERLEGPSREPEVEEIPID